jgi:mandelate racemase
MTASARSILDLTWVEEPVAAEDLVGHRAVRERVRRVPIQTGENWWFPHEMAKAICGRRDRPCDGRHHEDRWYYRLDVGDGTGGSGGAAFINHTFVEPSAHVMAVAPTPSWFEYLDIAGAVLSERLVPVDGMVTPRGPELGLDWDETAVPR